MYTEVWQSKELTYTRDDLNIKAVLLDTDSEVHEEKIFDSTASDIDSRHLRQGAVIDISRMRSQLFGMQKNKYSYVGRKPELYEVIKNLSSRSPCPLVHIKGNQHVGKKRFVQEVCYYFYQHNQFRYVILCKDLSKIELYHDFKDFMEMLN